MKPSRDFFRYILILLGLVPFLACGPEDFGPNPAANPAAGGSAGQSIASPSSAATSRTAPYSGEMSLKENFDLSVAGDTAQVKTNATVPFKVSYNQNLGLWKISGSTVMAKGDLTAVSHMGAKCDAKLVGNVDMSGTVVDTTRFKPCKFQLQITMKWDPWGFYCNIPGAGEVSAQQPALEYNHFININTSRGEKSAPVKNMVMNGYIFLKITRFSNPTIAGCAVEY
jgi:hypothetical protein